MTAVAAGDIIAAASALLWVSTWRCADLRIGSGAAGGGCLLFRHCGSPLGIRGSYNRPQLICYTYEWALSETSEDMMLHTFFKVIKVSLDKAIDDVLVDEDKKKKEQAQVFYFRAFLMDKFFPSP